MKIVNFIVTSVQNMANVTSVIDKSIDITTIKDYRKTFFVTCPRDHRIIGRLKCLKTSRKQFSVS